MNLLVDALPKTVDVDGIEYPIRTDFRVSVLFEMMMRDDELSDTEKIINALQLYYSRIPKDPMQAIDKILWFYRCGKDLSKKNTENTINMSEDSKEDREEASDEDNDTSAVQQIYSFDYDDEYIYAAFMEQYGIDLQDVQHLHWWKFHALFKSLKEDCEFVKIMGYRSIKVTGKMSKEQRQFYTKMKKIHALPVSDQEQRESDELVNALMNGGDLSDVLH